MLSTRVNICADLKTRTSCSRGNITNFLLLEHSIFSHMQLRTTCCKESGVLSLRELAGGVECLFGLEEFSRERVGGGGIVVRWKPPVSLSLFHEGGGLNDSLRGTGGVSSLKCLNSSLLKQGNTPSSSLCLRGISLTTPHLSSLLSSHSTPLSPSLFLPLPPFYMPLVASEQQMSMCCFLLVAVRLQMITVCLTLLN